MDCLPAYTTGAIFVSLILIDLFQRDWRQVPTRFLFGAVAVFLMTYVCEAYGSGLGWVLLAIPTFVLILGLYFVWSDAGVEQKPVEPTKPQCGGGCPCCKSRPCHCKRPCPKPSPPAC